MSETILIADVLDGKDNQMIFEENRLKSFINWSFSGKLSKEAMASAGFYHCNVPDEDTVRCFCCLKELGGWDPTDDPWAEHKRNNNCFYANLGKPFQKLTVKEFLKAIEERKIKLLYENNAAMEVEELKLVNELGMTQRIDE